MIDFAQLHMVTKVEDKEYEFMKKRYVIGADPSDQKGILSGVNVFIVYDKMEMRPIVKVVTSKTFDQFVEWIKKEPKHGIAFIKKSEVGISRKFINYNGTATNPIQIRK